MLPLHTLCLGCKGERCAFESKKRVQASRRRWQAANEDASGGRWVLLQVAHSGQLWGLSPSAPLGFAGFQSRWVLHEENESRLHPAHPRAITQAWSPATSQSCLHPGLTVGSSLIPAKLDALRLCTARFLEAVNCIFRASLKTIVKKVIEGSQSRPLNHHSVWVPQISTWEESRVRPLQSRKPCLRSSGGPEKATLLEEPPTARRKGE